MKCKMCGLQNLLILLIVIIVVAIFYNVEDEYLEGTIQQFLILVATMGGIAILFYSIKAIALFLWKSFKNASSQNILIYTLIVLMLIMILFPPYIITNKNHIPTQTGYSFLFLLDEIKYRGYAASVDMQLLLIQLFILFMSFGLLFFLTFKRHYLNRPKDDLSIHDAVEIDKP